MEVENQEVKEEINNSLADLEAAWDQVESEEAASQEEAESEGVEEYEEPKVEEAAETDKAEKKESTEVADTKYSEEVSGSELKPPAGWTPEAREGWADLPEKVKQQVLKRERDFAMGIQYTREAAQRAMQYDDLLKPFQPMFAANGQDVISGVRQILGAAASLQMGSQAQKVKTVADLIHQYGVDLVSLDNYLAEGTVPQSAQQNDQLQQMLEQRLAPLNQMYQQYQQYQQTNQQRMAQEAGQTIQQFAADPKNEFYNDVKMDMADLLDLAASRNQRLTLEEAYQRACMMNPQIAQVLQTRQQASQLEAKRKASSSVRGAPAPKTPAAQPDDIRSSIEAAWAELDSAR